jgi:hypothetical protein
MAELRTRTMLVRFTPTEFDRVHGAANAAGRPMARYVREVALGAVPHSRRHVTDTKVVEQLARIGNNLNQLTHVANATDRFPTEARLDAVLAELMALADRIRHGDTL